MDTPTRNLAKYVKEKGINLKKIAEATGMPYTAVYDSLGHKERSRALKVGEMFAICAFLEKDPIDFADEAPAKDESA